MTDALSNNAPEDANPLEDRLRETHAELFAKLVNLEERASGAPATINDEDTAKAVTDLASELSKLDKAFDAVRVKEKEPYLDGSRTVDSVLGSPSKTLKDRKTTLMSRVNAHHNRVAEEQRRRAKEEADRQREEAEKARQAAEAARAAESHQEADQLERQAAKTDAVADAQAAKAIRGGGAITRTDSGARSFQTKVRTFKITDPVAFRASFGPMAPYLDKDAVAAALGRAARADPWPTIPGVAFSEETQSRVR